MPVPNRIDFKIATLTFKLLTTHQPYYLNSLINPYNCSRALRSSNQHLLDVPRISSATHSRAFSVYVPQLWNRLPQSLRDLAFQSNLNCTSVASSLTDPLKQASNLVTFKSNLKTFLFDCAPTSLIP